MERRSFLKALGLVSAVAAIPSSVIKAAEAIAPVAPAIEPAIPLLRPVRVYDMVMFQDGTQAIVVAMDQTKTIPTVDLKPVMYNQDLGNGMGMSKSYDKDTLPEIAQIIHSCVGEGESRVPIHTPKEEQKKDTFPYAAYLNSL